MEALFTNVKSFIKEPFNTPMSLWQYGALVGVTIVIVILWNFVLAEIVRGIREV